MCRWHTLDNVQHNSRGTQRFQSCGHYNMPDMLTVGQGAQTREEYRSQMALFAAMGSPLIIVTRTRTAGLRRSDGLRSLRMSCAQGTDIRRLSQESLAILTNPSLLAIDKDPNCVRWRCTSSCARVANLGMLSAAAR